MCLGFLWEICLFHLEGGTIPPYCVLQFIPIINIGVNRLCISIDFVLNKTLTKKDEIFLFTCMPCDHLINIKETVNMQM